MFKRVSCLLFAVVCLAIMSLNVNAQVNDHRFEVGGLFTSITLDNFNARTQSGSATGDSTVKGLGGRLSYNFNDNFAIDGEGSFFPESHLGNDASGEKLQGLIGIKAGVRNKWTGVFAKARPGVMWFGEFTTPGSCSATSFGSLCSVSHEKDFALDLGGVVEFYPSQRAIIRADIGDTIIHYSQRTFGAFIPTVLGAQTKNNLQISIGFGWRF